MRSFVLLVLAAAFAVIAWKILRVRFGRHWYFVGVLCTGLTAGVVVLVITSNFYDDFLGKARGDHGWANNGFVRAFAVVALPIAVGLLAFVVDRDRNSR